MAVQDSKRRVAFLTGITGRGTGAYPAEDLLGLGDASKARQQLVWKPMMPFAQLVKEMGAGDLDFGRQEVPHGKNPV